MPGDASGHVTELLQHWAQGDKQALGDLVPVVYQELRRLAHFHMASERAGHTLQSTALINEAFLRLIGGQPAQLQNRQHFVAVASRLMRQILAEYTRTRRALKRDGGVRVTRADVDAMPLGEDTDLAALGDALEALDQVDERQAKVVEMRFFGGLSAPEISQVLGISLATVERDWRTARIWLRREMDRTAQP